MSGKRIEWSKASRLPRWSMTLSHTQTRLLRRLLGLAPYPSMTFKTHQTLDLATLWQRGLVCIDPWGIVSLTWKGEAAAAMLL